MEAVAPARTPSLLGLAREWTRIGCIGFGGPPAHIALLRALVVERRGWLAPQDFEDAVAAMNLLPGPASTQLAIFCAWRVRGVPGALVGGAGFILPGFVIIVALAALFLEGSPPAWVRGAGAGAGAAVAAVALRAGADLLPASWQRAGGGERSPPPAGRRSRTVDQRRPPARADRRSRARWLLYVLVGALAAATVGPFLVLLLAACGLVEVVWRRTAAGHRPPGPRATALHAWPLLGVAATATGGLGALAWVAVKVGALSYGGGFVIIPLMQADAVDHYHWMTSGQFLNAVALGQVTPGPVVHTVAVVGYAAAGVGGAMLATAVAFAPSFSFVLLGARRFDRLRRSEGIGAFLGGAGPAAIGAILGSAVPLALALEERWQVAVLAAAVVALFVLRRGVVLTLAAAGAVGAALALAAAPLPS